MGVDVVERHGLEFRSHPEIASGRRWSCQGCLRLRHNVSVEPTEWFQEARTHVKYRASVDENLSLEALGAELMDKGEAGLQSVSWEVRKNGN